MLNLFKLSQWIKFGETGEHGESMGNWENICAWAWRGECPKLDKAEPNVFHGTYASSSRLSHRSSALWPHSADHPGEDSCSPVSRASGWGPAPTRARPWRLLLVTVPVSCILRGQSVAGLLRPASHLDKQTIDLFAHLVGATMTKLLYLPLMQSTNDLAR